MKHPAKKIIIHAIAAVFIFLFTYTGLSKILNHSSFEATLHQSPVIKSVSPIVAWLIPATELIISLLLFFPQTRLKGLYASLILMIGFTLYIGYMLLFTPNLPCSCGGVIQTMSWKQHLVFNIFFILLAGISIWLHTQEQNVIAANSAVFV